MSDVTIRDVLMALQVPSPKAMRADRLYDSDSFRQDLLIHEILPVIPSRKKPQRSTKNRLAALQ